MDTFNPGMVRNAILVISATVFTILILNIGVWIADIAPRDVPYWRTNPRNAVMHHVKEDFDVTYETNLRGLRSRRDIGPKNGKIRIVHVGDSYTFGWGVEEAYSVPFILERLLRERLNSNAIEVINLGVPGTNPFNFYRYVKKYARALEADIILVSLFQTRNTFLNGRVADAGGMEAYVKGVRNWAERENDPEIDIRKTIYWLLPLYRFAWRAIKGIDYQLFGVDWPGPKNTILVKRNKFLSGVFISKAHASKPKPEPKLEGWSDLANQMLLHPETFDIRMKELTATMRIVDLIAEESRKMGAAFVTLILPVDFQILDWEEPSHAAIAYSTRMDVLIAGLCVDFGIRCIHGSKRMREFAKRKKRSDFVFADAHFKPNTNAVFAEIAFDAIVDDVRRKLKH